MINVKLMLIKQFVTHYLVTLRRFLKKEVPFAFFAFGLFVPICVYPVIFAFSFFASGYISPGLTWLVVVLSGFLIMILVPTVTGWYFGYLRSVRYLAYSIYSGLLGSAMYTVYYAGTCTEAECGAVLFLGILAVITANFFLFTFVLNMKRKSILASIYIMFGVIVFGLIEWLIILWGLSFLFGWFL
jgi:O-antigen/teichoic acid export membrane protein